MKMIIFGATGTVGQKLVEQAVEKGYEVTAFVRHPEKWQHTHLAKVILFKGDVLNVEDVEASVRQQEVVMCALGDGKVGKIRALGTQNIIEAMKKEGIKRLICQTTLGMGESYGNLNFFWKHLMFGILLKRAFKDHQLQEEYILNSNLDYTIVRPSALTDGAWKHPGPSGSRSAMSRAAVVAHPVVHPVVFSRTDRARGARAQC